MALAAVRQGIAIAQGSPQQQGSNPQAGGNNTQNTIQRREQDVNQVATCRFILREQGILQPRGAVLSGDNSLYEVYTFKRRRGQFVTITMSSNEFDTYLIFLDEDNEKIAENDHISDSDTNSEIRITLPANGTYQVIANTYDSSGQGRFLLTVR
ncbi:PPC domain-containing protein [Phormidium tenue FACHB-886]|nr:PPC domain-containing protein [Phormidium tenue FACHB-886]